MLRVCELLYKIVFMWKLSDLYCVYTSTKTENDNSRKPTIFYHCGFTLTKWNRRQDIHETFFCAQQIIFLILNVSSVSATFTFNLLIRANPPIMIKFKI